MNQLPLTLPRNGWPRTRRERRRAETRERIFRAALKLFTERGVAATSVADITEAADVGKGTFFNYFPSKEHVLAAFGEMQAGKLRAVWAGAAPGEPVRQTLRRAIRALAEEPGRSPALVRSLVGAFLSSEAVRQIMRRKLTGALRFQASILAAVQKRGRIRADRAPADVARFLMQNWFGALVFWTLYPSEDLNKRLEDTFDLVVSAIEARPAGQGVAL